MINIRLQDNYKDNYKTNYNDNDISDFKFYLYHYHRVCQNPTQPTIEWVEIKSTQLN